MSRAWPLHAADAGAFSMAELRAKAEGLRASANQATDNLRASANKTGKQCVTSPTVPYMVLTKRVARRHGFPCWFTLRAYLDAHWLVAGWPHARPMGQSLVAEAATVPTVVLRMLCDHVQGFQALW